MIIFEATFVKATARAFRLKIIDREIWLPRVHVKSLGKSLWLMPAWLAKEKGVTHVG